MKVFRIAIAAVFALCATSAYAFHSGGVAECGGCHNMHAPATPQGGLPSNLLIGVTPSSTCLSCHAAADAAPTRYHVMTYPAGGVLNTTVPVERGAGGDFAWVAISTTANVRGTMETTTGQSRGHNIYAPDFGILSDSDNPTAPGSAGAFATSNLGCNSCHDPHGKLRRIASAGSTNGDAAYTWGRTGAPIIASGSYQNSPVPTATQAVGAYRLLRGRGDGDVASGLQYVPGSGFGGNFLAVAPNSYGWNSTEATDMTRVAYGVDGGLNVTDTVGRWCASCHADMHSTGTTQPLVHPIDQQLGSGLSGNYNQYVSSGIMTGSATTSFLSLVPFAMNTGDFGALKAVAFKTSTAAAQAGPASNSQVVCLSCHRAHASGFKFMLRWNYEGGEFLTDSAGAWKFGDSGSGLSAAQVAAAYADIPASKFGAYQRQLCNKCHAKD